MTTYDVFMHYYNNDIGKSVTNQTDCIWYSGLTKSKDYLGHEGSKEYLTLDDMDETKLEKGQESLEIIYMSKNAATTVAENTEAYNKYITDSNNIQNPKYDMIFIWDGMEYYNSTITNSNDKDEVNQLYFDKMKRINFRPWFFHSTYHSLKAAMTKAEQLIDLFGKDHIMIGKEVPLDQYIEIV